MPTPARDVPDVPIPAPETITPSSDVPTPLAPDNPDADMPADTPAAAPASTTSTAAPDTATRAGVNGGTVKAVVNAVPADLVSRAVVRPRPRPVLTGGTETAHKKPPTAPQRNLESLIPVEN
ncbi:hypothetical protein H0H92_002248, partial [Tricholoma furcatifolium]